MTSNELFEMLLERLECTVINTDTLYGFSFEQLATLYLQCNNGDSTSLTIQSYRDFLEEFNNDMHTFIIENPYFVYSIPDNRVVLMGKLSAMDIADCLDTWTVDSCLDFLLEKFEQYEITPEYNGDLLSKDSYFGDIADYGFNVLANGTDKEKRFFNNFETEFDLIRFVHNGCPLVNMASISKPASLALNNALCHKMTMYTELDLNCKDSTILNKIKTEIDGYDAYLQQEKRQDKTLPVIYVSDKDRDDVRAVLEKHSVSYSGYTSILSTTGVVEAIKEHEKNNIHKKEREDSWTLA